MLKIKGQTAKIWNSFPLGLTGYETQKLWRKRLIDLTSTYLKLNDEKCITNKVKRNYVGTA